MVVEIRVVNFITMKCINQNLIYCSDRTTGKVHFNILEKSNMKITKKNMRVIIFLLNFGDALTKFGGRNCPI